MGRSAAARRRWLFWVSCPGAGRDACAVLCDRYGVQRVDGTAEGTLLRAWWGRECVRSRPWIEGKSRAAWREIFLEKRRFGVGCFWAHLRPDRAH